MTILLRQILVPTDFSDRSEVALTYGVALTRQFDASLHLLHVVESITVAADPQPWQWGSREEIDHAIASHAWDDLHRVIPAEDQRSVRVQFALEWGMPFVEIIRYAKAHAIDLIAMGTHGRSAVKHLVMGSVAENVVRTAPCPVLTVRHPEHEFVFP
jgi:nucleotide-binding universal stress UspA family protein